MLMPSATVPFKKLSLRKDVSSLYLIVIVTSNKAMFIITNTSGRSSQMHVRVFLLQTLSCAGLKKSTIWFTVQICSSHKHQLKSVQEIDQAQYISCMDQQPLVLYNTVMPA